jgi:hypothetical protein
MYMLVVRVFELYVLYIFILLCKSYFLVICKFLEGKYAEGELYNIIINHKSNPLLEVSFDSSMLEKISSEKTYLGCFNSYDDLVVKISSADSDAEAERVAIPIMFLENESPNPLILAYASIEVEIIFEAEESQLQAPYPSDQPKVQEAENYSDNENKTSSQLASSTYPSSASYSSGKTTFRLKTVDLYRMLKSSLIDRSERQHERILELIRVIKLVSYYLLEGSQFISIIVVDLTEETLKLFDQLLLSVLESVDKSMDFGHYLLSQTLTVFIQILRYQLSWVENSVVGMLRSSAILAAPLLRSSWNMAMPIIKTSRKITKPLVSPIMNKLMVTLRENSSMGQLIDDVLKDINQILTED